MLNVNKHNVYKYLLSIGAIFFGVSLAAGNALKGQGITLSKQVVWGGMSLGLGMCALGFWTWLTGTRSPKNAKQVAQAKANELLDIIMQSKVGPLLTNAPKGVAVRITELIEDLDITERPTCEALLDEVYRQAPACVLSRTHGETDVHYLNWYQYDVCITAAKEDLDFAKKIRNALLDRHPGCRIYLDVEAGGWVKGDFLERVFYASSWKCVALLSRNVVIRPGVVQPGRRPELDNAMRRDQYGNEEDCRKYLMPIPLDDFGLDHMKQEVFLQKYAEHIEIVEDHDDLCKVIVDTLSKFIKRAAHYDHLADIYMKSYEDGETIPTQKRFAIALSFPSALQILVQAVVEELEKLVPGEEVFYYPKLRPELSGSDLYAKLQSYYRTHSELVAVFLCAGYASSLWCRWEWWRILDLLNHQSRKTPLLLRFDKAHIPRLPPNQAYIDCQHFTPREIAELIVARLRLNRQQ